MRSINNIYSWFEIIVIGVVVSVIVATSLIIQLEIGLIPLMVIVIYLGSSMRYEYASKISFSISLVVITLTTFFYIIDITEIMYKQIRLLSEWSYLFAIVGLIQMVLKRKE